MDRKLARVTHSFPKVIHINPHLNQGFELGFYNFSTVLPSSYYYYLYIKKSLPQADRTHHPLTKTNFPLQARYVRLPQAKLVTKQTMRTRATA